MQHNSCNRIHKRGLTLVEVMAALVLLAGMASTILIAQARSMLQLQTTREQRKASDLAQDLLASWRLDETNVQEPDHGAFSDAGWSWRREVFKDRIPTERSVSPDTSIVRIGLTIFHDALDQSQRQVFSVEWLQAPRRKPRI